MAGTAAGITRDGTCWCVIPPPPQPPPRANPAAAAQAGSAAGPPVLRAVVMRGLDAPLLVARHGPKALEHVVQDAGTAAVGGGGHGGRSLVTALGEAALRGFCDPERVSVVSSGDSVELHGAYPPIGEDEGEGEVSCLRSPTIRIPLREADVSSGERSAAHAMLQEALLRQAPPAPSRHQAGAGGESSTGSPPFGAFGRADGLADTEDDGRPVATEPPPSNPLPLPLSPSPSTSSTAAAAAAHAPATQVIQSPKRRAPVKKVRAPTGMGTSGGRVPSPRPTRPRLRPAPE